MFEVNLCFIEIDYIFGKDRSRIFFNLSVIQN